MSQQHTSDNSLPQDFFIGKQPKPNVILFGESGAGKSSVVNMLDGQPLAGVSDGTTGRTICNIPYEKVIVNKNTGSFLTLKVFDTVGLKEATEKVGKQKDIMKTLGKLIRGMKGGANLLVYVVRGPKMSLATPQIYKVVYETICHKRVPIVMVVTYMEEEDMDSWWGKNEAQFNKHNMRFDGHACITASPGKRRGETTTYQEEFERSKEKVDELVYHAVSKIPQTSVPNVIVFGESGAGKGLVLDMLESGPIVGTSKSFGIPPCDKRICGSVFRVYDAAGLSGGLSDTPHAQDAIQALHMLIRQLDDGVNLLIFVMQAPHITEMTRQNYEMFYDTFCQRKVPIVIIITGLETMENMDEWWGQNEDIFRQRHMVFDGHACITVKKGILEASGYTYQRKYDESKRKVEQLILQSFSWDAYAWKMVSKSWDGVRTILSPFGVLNSQLQLLSSALQKYAGLTKPEARDAAKRVERRLRATENE